MARQHEGTPLEVVYDSEAAPTVARQQCGQSGGLAAFREALELPRWYSDSELLSAILAYLTYVTPPDAAKIARSLEALAEHLSDQPLTHADSTDLATIRKAATALRLSAGGGVPEGWKLVPVEPTPEMLGAFWRQKNCGTQEVGERGPHTDDCSAYRAMLAASPTVEAGHVE